MHRRTYTKNSIVFQEGQRARQLYVLWSGQARVCRVNDAGQEITVAICSEGDVLGEMALLDGGRRSATVITMTRSELLLLHRDDFLRCLAAHDSVSMHVIQVLCERLRATTSRTGQLAYLDVEQRLSHLLVDLCRRHGTASPPGIRIDVRLTQGDLATLLGTSRESVNRALATFRARGLVRQRGMRLIVTDPAALEREIEIGR